MRYIFSSNISRIFSHKNGHARFLSVFCKRRDSLLLTGLFGCVSMCWKPKKVGQHREINLPKFSKKVTTAIACEQALGGGGGGVGGPSPHRELPCRLRPLIMLLFAFEVFGLVLEKINYHVTDN